MTITVTISPRPQLSHDCINLQCDVDDLRRVLAWTVDELAVSESPEALLLIASSARAGGGASDDAEAGEAVSDDHLAAHAVTVGR